MYSVFFVCDVCTMCVVCVQNVYTNPYSSSTAAWHDTDVVPPRLGLRIASPVARVRYVRAGSPAMTLETEPPVEYSKCTINITVNTWFRSYFTINVANKCTVRLMIS